MNNPPEVNIAKMRKNRTLLADEVYRAAKGSSANRVFLWDLAKNLGIAEDEAKEIRAYYQDEGYFEKVSGGLVSLSDYGIARIEESILDSKAPADLVLDIRERQQLRVLLLKRLFEKTGVSTRKKVNLYDIAKGEGIAEGDISGFLNYLKHEGFIKFVGGAVWYYITDKGIDAVGELIEAQADDKQTSRFDQQSGNVQSVEIVPSQKLKVFLCHSSRNKPIVLELYDRLLADGVEPWLDVKNILGGQKWELEIKKAVRDSDAIIVCISKDAMDNKGYYHKEIKLVLDEADKQPEDHIFIIPLLLEECEIPERFIDIHCLNYQKPGSYESFDFGTMYRPPSAR